MMQQIISYVDWNHVFMAVLVVVAFGGFINYSVSLTRGPAMRGVAFVQMGVASLMMLSAARIANPDIMNPSSGFNFWLAISATTSASLLIAYGVISNLLRRRREKMFRDSEEEE